VCIGELQLMGGIILVLLVLLGFSYVIPQRSAAEEWKPQSQLQVSHGQTDLYQQLNHNHRPAIGRRPQPGAPVELPVNVDVMGRRLHPGAPGEYAAVPPPRRTSGDIRAGVNLFILSPCL